MRALKYWDGSAWKTVAASGAGVPVGGTANQILSKIDATDYNTQWVTPTAYQPLDSDLTAIAAIAGARGDILFYGASGWTKLTAGTSGQQLTTGGAGADPSWAAAGSGGGTPGGSNTHVQYNDSSAFGGDANLIWDKTAKKLTLSGGGGVDSALKVGNFEFQPYALNNCWLGDNIYFDNTAFKYRATGYGGRFYFYNGEGQFRMSPSGTAGASVAADTCQFIAKYDGSVALGGFILPNSGYSGAQLIVGVTGGLSLPSASAIVWPIASSDLGISRNAAGVLEINNATGGVYRDLKLRNLILSGGTQIPAASPTGQFLKDDGTYATIAGGGNVSTSGTIPTGQYGRWAGATALESVTAATVRTDLGLVIGTNVQAFDADLTTWAGITPAAGIGTFLATPSSANFLAAITNETGSGLLMFATSPDITTGFTIGGASTARKIVVSDGTRFVPSTETWPVPGAAGNQAVSDGTNWTSVTPPATIYANASTGVQNPAAAEAYLAGSTITLPAGAWKVGGAYHCTFDMSKTTTGTAGIILTVRMGTLGTTGDASIVTITYGVGTGVADIGIFDVWVTFRSVGSGTSAVIGLTTRCTHGLAATGLTTTGASGTAIPTAVLSSGFNSTTQTKLGITFTGGTSFSGTNGLVQTEYKQ
jgi:hypothetical protein